MATMFHRFEVTRPLRGSPSHMREHETAHVAPRMVIIPVDPSLPADGYWVARQSVARCFPNATEIRALGRSTQQIWEVY